MPSNATCNATPWKMELFNQLHGFPMRNFLFG